MARDPLIWAGHPASNRHEEAVFREFFDDGLASGGALVIVDRATAALIGSSRYYAREAGMRGIEIGWTFLARAYWGGAINAELKRLMIGHALSAVDVVEFRIGETNARSRRAIEKLGAVLTDREIWYDTLGCPTRHVIYEVTRAGFITGPLSISA